MGGRLLSFSNGQSKRPVSVVLSERRTQKNQSRIAKEGIIVGVCADLWTDLLWGVLPVNLNQRRRRAKLLLGL